MDVLIKKGRLFWFLLLFLISAPFCTHAQQFVPKWVNDFGSVSGFCQVNDVGFDKQNNVYITGSFSGGTFDFDPGPGVKNLQAGSTGIFAAKYKQDGTLIWAESFPCQNSQARPYSLAIDKDGNISIVGEFAGGTIDADPGTGVYNLVAKGQDGFLIHLDNNGNFLWARSTGGFGYEGAIQVVTDSQNDIIVTSTFSSIFTIGNTTYTAPKFIYVGLIAKYDPSGNVIWTIPIGINGASEQAMGCRVDSQDNIVVSGIFNGTVNFNPLGSAFNLNASSADESFIAKYSPSGGLVWVKAINATLSPPIGINNSTIDIDNLNNIYFVSAFVNSISFGSVILNAKGSQDVCIAKYSAAGVLQYAKSIGGPSTPTLQSYARSVKIVSDKSDNIYVTGAFGGTVNFNPNPGNAENLSVAGHGTNFYVAEYDTNGNYIIAFNGGNSACGGAFGFGLAVDNVGNIDFSGQFCSTINFDPTGCTTTNVTAVSTAYIDGFVVQYAPLVISNNRITAPNVAVLCTGNAPTAISGSTPLGGAGTYGYQWQSSPDSLNFTDIAGATAIDYTPATLSTSTFYRRIVSVKCASPVASNVVSLQVVQPLTAPVVTIDSTTASSIIFKWTAVTGATGYQVSTDGGQTFNTPSSGATGLTNTVTGLENNESVTLIVKALGTQACQLSTASATGRALNLKNDIIYVPNALTPGGDDKNSQVHVHSENIKSLQFYVYDQWGELIFTSNDVKNGWDGTFKGKREPVGVYVYYLTAVMNDGQSISKKGTITLIR